MFLEILISCMDQEDMAIVEKSGITTDVLIINQCSKDDYQEVKRNHLKRMISTTERGLSNSRNMAIKHAAGDICLFCDDDEIFYHGYEQMVLAAFRRLPDADIVLFDFDNLPHGFKNYEHKLKYIELLHAISCQIAFRKEAVIRAGVQFNPCMGAGSGNGAQEENKFLMDCFKRGLNIYYVPQKLGCIIESDSTWFDGFDEKFFYQRGGATRQLLGLPLSILYAFYYVIRKREMYCHEISARKALLTTIKGCLENPIGKQMKMRKEE